MSAQALDAIERDKAAIRHQLAEAEHRTKTTAAQFGVVTEGQRAALRRVGDQIRHSPGLYPWMRAYAEWLTLECVEIPKISGRMAKARGMARAPVSNLQLKLLEARPDFITYVKELESGPLERARRRFEASFPEYVEAHREALDAARDANDYTAIARIAEPVLDRVMPKRSDNAQATQVNITLSPNQLAGVSASYEAPPMVVDEVVVEAPAE
jgi:hypothetical protein